MLLTCSLCAKCAKGWTDAPATHGAACFHRLLPAHHPDHAGSDLLRCVAAFRRHRGGRACTVLYPDLPHLFQRAVLLRGGHYLAVPPGDARHEVQLLLRMALCAFLVLASTCSCFNQFMNSVYVVTQKSQRSMVTMMAGAISNCIMNYFFIKLWGLWARLCVLPWPCAGVHPACGGRPPHDRDARPPGAGAGKRCRTGI